MGSIAPAGVNPPPSPNAASKLTSTKSTIAPTRTSDGTLRKLPAPQIVAEPWLYIPTYIAKRAARQKLNPRAPGRGQVPSADGGPRAETFGYGCDVSMN